MMNMKSILEKSVLGILAISSLAGTEALAANGKGNGGRGWVCYKTDSSGKVVIDPKTRLPVIDKVELMDFIEGRTITNWRPNLGVDQPGVDDTNSMIDTFLARVGTYDKHRRHQIELRLAEIRDPKKTHFLDLASERAALNLIPDANVLIAPIEGDPCRELPLAFNKTNPNVGERKYVFVKQFLEAMDDTNRAGLLLHEALYNYEATMKAQNSDGTRMMIAAISDPEFMKFDLKGYYDFMAKETAYNTVSTAYAGFSKVSEWTNNPDLPVSVGMIQNESYFKGIAIRDFGRGAETVVQYLPIDVKLDSETGVAEFLIIDGKITPSVFNAGDYLGLTIKKYQLSGKNFSNVDKAHLIDAGEPKSNKAPLVKLSALLSVGNDYLDVSSGVYNPTEKTITSGRFTLRKTLPFFEIVSGFELLNTNSASFKTNRDGKITEISVDTLPIDSKQDQVSIRDTSGKIHTIDVTTQEWGAIFKPGRFTTITLRLDDSGRILKIETEVKKWK